MKTKYRALVKSYPSNPTFCPVLYTVEVEAGDHKDAKKKIKEKHPNLELQEDTVISENFFRD